MKKNLFFASLLLATGAFVYSVLGEEKSKPEQEIPKLEEIMTTETITYYVEKGEKKPLLRMIGYLEEAVKDYDGTKQESRARLLLAQALLNAMDYEQTLKVVESALEEERNINERAKFLFLGIPAAYQLGMENHGGKEKKEEEFLGKAADLMREYCRIASQLPQKRIERFKEYWGEMFKDVKERNLLNKEEAKKCEEYFK